MKYCICRAAIFFVAFHNCVNLSIANNIHHRRTLAGYMKNNFVFC